MCLFWREVVRVVLRRSFVSRRRYVLYVFCVWFECVVFCVYFNCFFVVVCVYDVCCEVFFVCFD